MKCSICARCLLDAPADPDLGSCQDCETQAQEMEADALVGFRRARQQHLEFFGSRSETLHGSMPEFTAED